MPAIRARSRSATAWSARSRWSTSTPPWAVAPTPPSSRICSSSRHAGWAAASATQRSAIAWLDRGALKVVLGTAARPEVLRELPKERVIAALDARHGEVVVEGWQKRTGHGVLERIAELRDLVGGFLVTFVEREGRLQGTDLAFAKEIRAAAGDAEVTIAGGITRAEEIAELDRLGCDAQVGMALYTGRLGLAEAFTAPVRSDRPDGLWPTVVVDERGVALGLCYSDLEFAAGGPGAGPRRLPLTLAWPVGQGRDLRRHPGAAPGRRRLRSRLPALYRAPAAARLLSSEHAHLLGRRRWPRRARAQARGTQDRRARRLLHCQAASRIRRCSAPSCARRRTSWPKRPSAPR